MEAGIGIAVIVIAVVLTIVFALCKSSGTKDEVDQKAIEYLRMQTKGHDDRIDKQKHMEDKE